MSRAVLAALPLVLLALPALAQEGPNCEDPTSQAEMTGCAGLEWEAADAELNSLWPKVHAAAKEMDGYLKESGGDGRPGYAETLLDAQRKWIDYRDAECQYEGYQARGGTMEPMLINFCLARLTEQRVEDFKRFLEEGNL